MTDARWPERALCRLPPPSLSPRAAVTALRAAGHSRRHHTLETAEKPPNKLPPATTVTAAMIPRIRSTRGATGFKDTFHRAPTTSAPFSDVLDILPDSDILPFSVFHPHEKPPLEATMSQSTILTEIRDAFSLLQNHLSLPQLTCLVAIAAEPGLSVTDLAQRTGLPQATTSRNVSTLLGRYQAPSDREPPTYITQSISINDPRRRSLHLNTTGQRLIDNLLRALHPTPN